MDFMDSQLHWDKVYRTNPFDQVSWFRPHLETSLALIERASANSAARIIDIGGGASTLADDLMGKGYGNLTVLDISQTAIDVARARLNAAADKVKWLAANVIHAELPETGYDIWHDRAVFHFLTDSQDRAAYIQKIKTSVRIGGHVVIGTFGPEGPGKCSGLNVRRYDAQALDREFGEHFRLIDSREEVHRTPLHTDQQFVYCLFAVE